MLWCLYCCQPWIYFTPYFSILLFTIGICFLRFPATAFVFLTAFPLGDVSWTYLRRLMYVQFKSCVQGIVVFFNISLSGTSCIQVIMFLIPQIILYGITLWFLFSAWQKDLQTYFCFSCESIFFSSFLLTETTVAKRHCDNNLPPKYIFDINSFKNQSLIIFIYFLVLCKICRD